MDGIHFQNQSPVVFQPVLQQSLSPNELQVAGKKVLANARMQQNNSNMEDQGTPLRLSVNHRVEMAYHEDLHQVVVKVIDRDTDKVIEEFPAEEIQKVRLRIRQDLGSIIDEEA